VDVENFDAVLGSLPVYATTNISSRLGILNTFNALRPDRYYQLDLRNHDHYVMANILAKLALVEEGVNFVCPGGKAMNERVGGGICGLREGCQCHFYRDENRFRSKLHNLAWGVPDTWDDSRYMPDIADYVRNPKGVRRTSSKPKGNMVAKEGRLNVKYVSDDVNTELREFLNKEFTLVGVPMKRPVDRFSRHHSFKMQGLLK